MLRLTLLLLLCCPLLVSAQIYKHVDEDGNVTFTDTPPPNSEKVDLPVSNTAVPPPVISAPPPPAPAPTKSYTVAITQPEPEAVIPRGPGNFSVAATVSPAPDSVMQMQLTMDGDPYGPPQAAPVWNLTNVPRGTHELRVSVVDGKGKAVSQSEPITVYVFRPSVNF